MRHRWILEPSPILISFGLVFAELSAQSNTLATLPSGGGTNLQRGGAALGAHQYSEAVRWFTEALKTESTKQGVVAVYVNRGIAWCELKHVDHAKADFESAIRVMPYLAEAYADAGWCLFHAGRYADALSFYQRGMKAARRNVSLINNYAWFIATCPDASFRNGVQAVSLAKEACEMSRWKDLHHIDTLAAAEAEVGAFDAAIAHGQQILASPNLDSAWRHNLEERLRKYRQHQPYHERPTLPTSLGSSIRLSAR